MQAPNGRATRFCCWAEFDLELLVQVTLDTLIDAYVEDPGLAHQTRREIRGSDAGAAPA
jgi:hypothetical protein